MPNRLNHARPAKAMQLFTNKNGAAQDAEIARANSIDTGPRQHMLTKDSKASASTARRGS